MPGLGTWRAPLPLRLGGGGERRISTLLATLRAQRPQVLSSREDGSEVDLETRAMARMLWAALRDTERQVAQRDPRKLSDLRRDVVFPDGSSLRLSAVERWERVLGLVPARGASSQARRAAIFAALVAVSSTRRSAVETTMAGAFGAWYVGLGENRLADVDYPGRSPRGDVSASWPVIQNPPTPDALHSASYPGRYSTTRPWSSGLCHVVVLFRAPASTSQVEIDAKVGKALQLLDDQLPAWMTFATSQLPADQTDAGFYAGVSLVGLTSV